MVEAAQVCAEDTHLLLVALTEMVAAVQEAVATHDPLLLDKALETENGSTVGVHHHLCQRRNEAAEVRGVVLCGRGGHATLKFNMYLDQCSEGIWSLLTFL